MSEPRGSRIGETILLTIRGVESLATCIGETEDREIVYWTVCGAGVSGTWWGRLWDLSRSRQGLGRGGE